MMSSDMEVRWARSVAASKRWWTLIVADDCLFIVWEVERAAKTAQRAGNESFTGRERGNVVVVGQESCCKLPTCPCAHKSRPPAVLFSNSGQRYRLSDDNTLSGYYTQHRGSQANVEADADEFCTTFRPPTPVANTMPRELRSTIATAARCYVYHTHVSQ